MKTATITVTDAARNFADCVNRAHYQQVTFLLVKNGKAMARLVPEKEKCCSGRDLAEVVSKSQLTEEDASDWQRDLKAARKKIKHPRDKWQ